MPVKTSTSTEEYDLLLLEGIQRNLQALLSQESASPHFFCVPVWTGPFDIEIECIAVRKD
jgi:hypothetical protein